jgi:altronate hydrolase
MKELIKIHSRDNVVIALKPFSKGDVIEVDGAFQQRRCY